MHPPLWEVVLLGPPIADSKQTDRHGEASPVRSQPRPSPQRNHHPPALRPSSLPPVGGPAGDFGPAARGNSPPGEAPVPRADSVAYVLRTSGSPLDSGTRETMEPRFGHDFSRVRIHTDLEAHHMAERFNARAFAVGSDVYFKAGEYQPRTPQGRRLLAHELAHVVQAGGAATDRAAHAVSEPQDDLEREASDVAALIVSGRSARIVQHAGPGMLLREGAPPGHGSEKALGERTTTAPPSRSPLAQPMTPEKLYRALTDLQTLLNNVLTLYGPAYEEVFEETRSIYGDVLAEIVRNFESAWARQGRVLSDARVAAEDENTVRGVVIGAVASVAAAAAAAAVPAIAAAQAWSATWWMSTTGQAVASSAGGTWAAGKEALKAPTKFESAVPRELGQVRQLQQLLAFERDAARAHQGVANVGRRFAQLTVLVDELRRDGATQDVRQQGEEFLRHKSQIEGLVGAYLTAWQAVTEFRRQLKGWKAPSVRGLERAIWVHWIASLKEEEHNLLDRDEIEDYLHGSIAVLGPSGIIPVDTRAVFDTELEKAAIRGARERWGSLEAELAVPRPRQPWWL